MKVILVAGARPNFMKVAPLIQAIRKHNSSRAVAGSGIDYVLVHTGQHYDAKMSDVFLNDLGIPKPDINLGVGSGSHAVQTANIMTKFEQVCLNEKPDWVLVVGDVNSTMACTLVAAKLGIKIGHIEAGLRSYDRSMPEEINRLVTDALADLLFTYSRDADENLIKEGVPPEKIIFVGNIMVDTLLQNLERAKSEFIGGKFGLKSKEYALVTIHRSGNTDDDELLVKIYRKLIELSAHIPVIFPVHPRTRNKLSETATDSPATDNLKMIEPLGYLDFQSLLYHSRFVITDSGGLQEETTVLRIPCLTLRPNTERPVTITVGTNKLVTLENLAKEVRAILGGEYKKGGIPELWDGKTAGRIVKILADPNLSARRDVSVKGRGGRYEGEKQFVYCR